MVKTIHVEGFDACMKSIDEEKGKTIYVLFSGSVTEDGKSWCPDCVSADPVIKDCLKAAAEDAVYIYCGVGGRDFWKDQTNVFRTNSQTKLKCVPTLLKWGSPQRLEEEQCSHSGLVQMMFEED